MGKYNKRVDVNDGLLARAWLKMGVSVLNLTRVGEGCPDKLLGIQCDDGTRINILVEIKDGSKPPSQRNLTPAQQIFHNVWRGPIFIISSVEEAVNLINRVKKRALIDQCN